MSVYVIFERLLSLRNQSVNMVLSHMLWKDNRTDSSDWRNVTETYDASRSLDYQGFLLLNPI